MTGDFGTIDSNLAGSGFALSSADQTNLRTAGKWARFLAIIGLVSMALVVLMMLFGGGTMMALMMGGGMGASPYDTGAAVGAGAFMFIFYGIFIAAGIYLYWLLYQFGDKAMKAVDSGNTALMSESLAAQSKMYKIIGILAAIYLGFLALAILFAVIGGAAAFL